MSLDISESSGSAQDHIRRALSKTEREMHKSKLDKLIKYEHVNELINKHGRNQVCYNAVREELGCSMVQARKYVAETIEYFSFEGVEEKKYWKRVHIDTISGIIARNKDNDDPKVLRVMAGLLKELREATGFDKAEVELPDFSELGQTVISITSDPEEVGLDKVKDANKFIENFIKNLDAEDAEFTEGD